MPADPSLKASTRFYDRASLGHNPHIPPIALLMLTVGLWYLQLAS